MGEEYRTSQMIFKSSRRIKIVLQSGFLPVDSQIEDDSINHVRQDN